MPLFKCPKCGHEYYDPRNFTGCPNCMGMDKADPRCICLKYRHGLTGKAMNLISKKNPECPVHEKK